MRVSILVALFAVAVGSSQAFAQESQFVAKAEEAMKPFGAKLESACGMKSIIPKWDGKLGEDPSQASSANRGNEISSLCTTGLAAVVSACANPVVKKKMGAQKAVACKKGKGALAYKVGGGKVWILVDTAAQGANQADLEKQIIKDLDK